MAQPSLANRRFWDRHVARVLAVLERALDLLDAHAPHEAENDLNRRLYFCLLVANHEALHTPLGPLDSAPHPEACNPPSPDDPYRMSREWKRPDFIWSVIDHQAADPRRGVRSMVVECKRLGTPPRAAWPLNENYVANGIARFFHYDTGYAGDDIAGAMVGYVQDMDLEDILVDVNQAATRESLPILPNPPTGWQADGTSHMRHTLVRTRGVSLFDLRHLWVDLRSRVVAGQSGRSAASTAAPVKRKPRVGKRAAAGRAQTPGMSPPATRSSDSSLVHGDSPPRPARTAPPRASETI